MSVQVLLILILTLSFTITPTVTVYKRTVFFFDFFFEVHSGEGVLDCERLLK